MTANGSWAQADPGLRRLIATLLVVRASGHLGNSQRRYPQWELANAELQRLLELAIGQLPLGIAALAVAQMAAGAHHQQRGDQPPETGVGLGPTAVGRHRQSSVGSLC